MMVSDFQMIVEEKNKCGVHAADALAGRIPGWKEIIAVSELLVDNDPNAIMEAVLMWWCNGGSNFNVKQGSDAAKVNTAH